MHRILVFPHIKYPKLILLGISYAFAFLLLANKNYPLFHNTLANLGYLGIFTAGMLYSYGLTAGPAASIMFLMSKQVDIFNAGIIAGIGSLFGDLIIFEFIRVGFDDELKKLGHEHLLRNIKVPAALKKVLLPVIASIFIASPLPDEIGVSMLATSKISLKYFSMLSFLLNTLGIYAILLLGL